MISKRLAFGLVFCAMAGAAGLALAQQANNPLADGEYVIGPDYKPAPELTVQPGVPVGDVIDFTMESKDSKIYPGIARTENEYTARRDGYGNRTPWSAEIQSHPAPYTRAVRLYIPKQYKKGTPVAFIVAQDGRGYSGRLPKILDNMIAAKRLPVIVAIMIDSGGSDAQGSERGLEYDTLSGRYSDFIETEVLPRITRDYGVTFTTNPEGRMTMGGSSGAAASFTMAWYHPERYHKVLSYSGTFVNQQSPLDPATPHGAWEYHEHLVPQAARKPIRIWMHVSDNDLKPNDPESTYHNWPLANRRMATALKAKGYHYRYVFAKGAGHTDGRVTDMTLPDALLYLWQGYPI